MPISIDAYAALHVRSNPGTRREDVIRRLRDALAAFQADERCACGERIWVIGSAEVGLMCFTCITGEAWPSEDYEIEEACLDPPADRGGSKRRRGREERDRPV